MATENNNSIQSGIRLPNQLFLFCVLIFELIPFLARFPSVPIRGWVWFIDYLPGIGALLFFSVFNIVPGIVLYGIGKGSERTSLAFWFALSFGLGFLLWAHGTLDLRSSSTASIALIFIPIYGAVAVVVGWVVGLLAHKVVDSGRGRKWLAVIIVIIAILFGVGNSVINSTKVSKREARFPVVTVKELPISKRTVYSDRSMGRVEVLALDNFDKDPLKEIAVLGSCGLALLKPSEYTIKTKNDFSPEDCDGCVNMYPYLVPDGKGSLLVASSDGLADSRGHLLWRLKASGFTRLIPIQVQSQQPTFLAYHNSDRIECFDIHGKIRWSVNINVSDIGSYVTPDGERLPFAITGYGKARKCQLFDLEGKLQRKIQIPDWASDVEEIAWPAQGHLLVGGRSWVSVLDQDGKEVFKHVIKDTSFDPYHGLNGTTVQFDPTAKPYLAIMSHGSSGYPRSVLLIFDSKGHLVWQEETKKLRTMLTVPRVDRKGEVLLVGGMDGVIEYSLNKTADPK